MATSLISWTDQDDNSVVWRHPEDAILLGSQLIVGEGQVAIFCRSGETFDVLETGAHTLTTGNLPLISRILSFPFNSNSPFPAQIWFVQTTRKMDMLWGTRSPIQLMDHVLGLPLSIRSYGRWGYRVTSPQRLIKQIVGNQSSLNAGKISEYFIGRLMQCLAETLATILKEGVSVLEIASKLETISEKAKAKLRDSVNSVGIELTNFDIESINFPEKELAELQKVFGKTFEAREMSKVQLSSSFSQIKTFDILEKSAQSNGDGTVSSLLNAGFGIGVGFPLGQRASESLQPTERSNVRTLTERLSEARKLLEAGLIDEAKFSEIQNKLLGEL